MVLLEIDAEGVSRIEFKGYAPRAIDMNRVTDGNETFEVMEIKPRKVHLFRCCYNIQAIKPDQYPFTQPGINLRRAAFRP